MLCPHAPLVVFTASDAATSAEATERLGAAGLVTKPFDVDSILALVDGLDPHAAPAPQKLSALPSP